MGFSEKAIANGKYTFKLAWDRANKYNAIPIWTTRVKKNKTLILNIYIQAQLKNFETKKRHQVDHIIPLYGVNICGLHVPQNLRILSKSANQAKSNFFRPYSINRFGVKTFLEAILPLPEKKKWAPPRKGKANPTKKSFKRRAKKLIYRKRNFSS